MGQPPRRSPGGRLRVARIAGGWVMIGEGRQGLLDARGWLSAVAKVMIAEAKILELHVPVQHLVFMVHGIGQRLEKSNLVDDVTNFRHITAKLAERHLTSYQRGTQRVLFIPCQAVIQGRQVIIKGIGVVFEIATHSPLHSFVCLFFSPLSAFQWRKGLKLSGEAAVEKITLDGVRGLRVMLSATVHDVLYYMSPVYCQDIVNSVSDQLNRLYLKFLKRNPGYDGKVSLYGHSLGSVLSYDIICHQENLSSPFPMEWMYKEHPANEETSSPTLNNQSADCNFKSTQNKNVGSLNNQTTGMVGPSEEDNAGAKQPFLVPEMEDSSFPTGFSVALDLDEPSATEVESKQPDAISSLGKDDHGQVSDSRDMLSYKREYFDEASNLNYQVLLGDAGKLSCSGSESDKDKTIKLLREEVVFSNLGNEAVSATTTNQSVSGNLLCGQNDTLNCYTPYIKYTKLEFEVDTFFAVGSPLGVFLALRNTRIGIGKGQEYWEEENITEDMPACCQMFNIFHPFDPVAYRLEPLICKEYVSKRPVIIPYHRGGKRLHIGIQECAEDLALRSQAIMDQLGSVRSGVEGVSDDFLKSSLEIVRCNFDLDVIPVGNLDERRRGFDWGKRKGRAATGRRIDVNEGEQQRTDLRNDRRPSSSIDLVGVKVLTLCQSRNKDNLDEESEDNLEKVERSYGSIMMERLTGSEDGRVDHMLQDKTFQHPYISAIGSHTNYWRDDDTALFILKHLYRDIPEEPELQAGKKSGSQKNGIGSEGWSDQREVAEEELPLTFADKGLIRSFSASARKIMKKQ
ncbi:hypothetical protein RHSIM_Rhsim08G0116000 [Rhododendron simsii]|uniref:DDHD domain-containing protein n=1 Tax=Rhododendron simsii TaxID=118357 RepID=A0A834GG28_RHOSS|nr:hypothetical protein RHSIM_Rhsim08G0116000 [Rhododendron simsii]